jgi:hypothetical protein
MLKGHATLVLTPFTTKAIVERLNICWQPDSILRKVIDSHVPSERQMAIYVRLRNAPPPSDPPGIRLLCRFLKAFANATDFFDIFNFMVECVARINGEDGYSQLMKEKLNYIEAAQYAIQFERMRQVNNMETLMLRGIRAPTMGIQEAFDQIDQIDRLAMVLYGRTDTLTPVCRTLDWPVER